MYDVGDNFDELYDQMVVDKQNSLLTIRVGFVGFTILVWDHFITFGDEMELIWKQPKTFMSSLFLFNRYIIPLGFIVDLFAYISPQFSTSGCKRFVRYQAAMNQIGVHVAALMMLRRVFALYTQKILSATLAIFFVIWCGVAAYVVMCGGPVPHTPAVHSCTLIFQGKFYVLATSATWFELAFETIVIGLIVARTLPYRPCRNANTIARCLLVDGLIYYAVICVVNVTSIVMVSSCPPGIRNMFGQIQLTMTVTMMSRITLSLPKTHRRIMRVDVPIASRWQDASTILPPVAFSWPGHSHLGSTEEPESGSEMMSMSERHI
ncbi:hypothetical protein CONPUDRAFT_84300 [Coniophora puteana RWD-64-598 SS2]|uniref:DUF6533 domain-containing protein n=1 Tax=Coniophora puteana (strain RWD-64-598) TaxID=741705 RepID=A0A5M3MDE4_CONPW|nr:uncharacterized protein CONPUDRAFT_84300 [Coniophora puteana RWD-64-598 SS2]EIW77047.1 hypothetical protein CONPUDRAFT_84300 [Coniophora puteana RWD-64-598 SS2]